MDCFQLLSKIEFSSQILMTFALTIMAWIFMLILNCLLLTQKDGLKDLETQPNSIISFLTWIGGKDKPGKYPIRKKVTTLKEKQRIRESFNKIWTNLKNFKGLKSLEIEVITEKNTEINTKLGLAHWAPNEGIYNIEINESKEFWGSIKLKDTDSEEEYSSWRTMPSLDSFEQSKLSFLSKAKKGKSNKRVTFSLD